MSSAFPASSPLDVRDYNRAAWDDRVRRKNRWTVPVSAAEIAAARRGQWGVVLTPSRPVPASWFPPVDGLRVLCLASGGGQQAPLLAAAGARVTVLDASAAQLSQDRMVAEREALELETIQGDMADLSRFASGTFDLVFHPVSNCFVSDVRPVWREANRVLRAGGSLLAGFVNPALYIFDDARLEQGTLEVRHQLPYSDLTSLNDAERQRYLDQGEPLVFGHTLEDQIAGQIDAGFVIAGFYEDAEPGSLLNQFMPTYIATRARKPAQGSAG